jgi:hypothetical protein
MRLPKIKESPIKTQVFQLIQNNNKTRVIFSNRYKHRAQLF